MFTYQCNDFTKVAIELEIITHGTAVISDTKVRHLHGARFFTLQLLSLTLASSLFLLLPLVFPWFFLTFWYGFEEVHSSDIASLHCWWSADRATHTDTWPTDCALKVLWTRLWVGTTMKILSQYILPALWPWPLIWMGTSLIPLFSGRHWILGRRCAQKSLLRDPCWLQVELKTLTDKGQWCCPQQSCPDKVNC